jgi:quinol monooxygenase YgiN
MTLAAFARLQARPGREADVEQAIRTVSLPTRAEPGCRSYAAYRSVRQPGLFTIHSTWTDRAAFDSHAALPHTLRFIEALEPLLDPPLQVDLAEPLAGVGGPSGAARL